MQKRSSTHLSSKSFTAKKQLSAELRKKIEVDEETDLVDEDPMVADHMEKENPIEQDQHTVIDQDIQAADRVQTHCTRPIVLRGHLQESHDEINQPSEIDQQDLTETNQDHQVSAEATQQEQVDQAPLLADQDQIGKISTPQFTVEAHCMRLRS